MGKAAAQGIYSLGKSPKAEAVFVIRSRYPSFLFKMVCLRVSTTKDDGKHHDSAGKSSCRKQQGDSYTG